MRVERMGAVVIATAGLLAMAADPARAQTENVAKCYVRESNGVLIIRNGQGSAGQCQALAVKCTGNPRVTSTFSHTPVIIHQNYRICGEL